MGQGRKIWQLLLLLLLFTKSDAQSFLLKADAETIGKNDVLQAEYEIKDAEDVAGFTPPVFRDWRVVAGPSTSQNMVSINGKISRSFSFIYSLMPLKTGRLTVPSASVLIAGKRTQCKPVEITVTNQLSVRPTVPPSSSGLQSLFDDPALGDFFVKDPVLKANQDPAEIMRKNIFLRASVNKQECYAGEPVLATYKLYTAIHTEAKVTRQPSFSGCSVIELSPEDATPVIEKVDGKNYRTYLVRKVALIPIQEGRLDLDTATVENIVSFADASNPFSAKRYSSTVHNQPLFVTVKPLPLKNKPADFSGAVGNFTITATVKEKSLEEGANDALLITISGNGNMQSVTPPIVEWPQNIDHFDAVRKENIRKEAFPLSGSINFDIPFIGTSEGNKVIPPVKFTYFDPVAGTYKQVHTDSIALHFSQALKQASPPAVVYEKQNLSNKKYLWIVAGIAVAAFVLLYFTMFKTSAKQTTPAPVPQQTLEEGKRDRGAEWPDPFIAEPIGPFL